MSVYARQPKRRPQAARYTQVMTQPLLFCVALIACLLALFNQSQPSQPAATRPTAAPPAQFDRYHLVMLVRGDNPPVLNAVESQRLQSEHLGHLKKMADDGNMLVAGPFSEPFDDRLRGMCLYNPALSRDKVRELASGDPAVVAGRLKVEVMDWYTARGALQFPLAAKTSQPAP